MLSLQGLIFIKINSSLHLNSEKSHVFGARRGSKHRILQLSVETVLSTDPPCQRHEEVTITVRHVQKQLYESLNSIVCCICKITLLPNGWEVQL